MRDKNDYDPYDLYRDIDKERIASNERRRFRNAINKDGQGSNAEHEKTVQVEEKGEGSILCVDKQEETRIEEMAPMKRRGRPTKEETMKRKQMMMGKDMMNEDMMGTKKKKRGKKVIGFRKVKRTKIAPEGE